jgi:hypothetical protein
VLLLVTAEWGLAMVIKCVTSGWAKLYGASECIHYQVNTSIYHLMDAISPTITNVLHDGQRSARQHSASTNYSSQVTTTSIGVFDVLFTKRKNILPHETIKF